MAQPHPNRELVLEEALRSPDGAGGHVLTWAEKGRIMAEMLPGAGGDPAGEEVTLTSVPWRIVTRAAPYGSDQRPHAGQRFREGARIFAILAVAERDRRGFWLTCFCREAAAR